MKKGRHPKIAANVLARPSTAPMLRVLDAQEEIVNFVADCLLTKAGYRPKGKR